jgi:hypothetical protein
MRFISCFFVSYLISLSSLIAKEEYITLEWGSSVTIPADKVAVFKCAYFYFPNIGNTLDILMISGTFNGEIETLPSTQLNFVVPTTKLRGGGPQGEGEPIVPLIIEGPTDLSLSLLLGSDPGTGAFANVVILLKDKISGSLGTQSSQIPLNTVVIPTDASGPVDIILESSTDLVNWTPALPGSYATSNSERFFRVRAVATGN